MTTLLVAAVLVGEGYSPCGDQACRRCCAPLQGQAARPAPTSS
eukprot:CAMPEP_0171923510 /NCGR_PEP_ID=MMETSP0993-20121228/22181_1 /TAXON_ID=483369 /ORGANISM="non described non described, Strain CCMP2098" /LENGTH=42 /DNA_ID= /DNA_START= /DNA_END= /DNA_ORIENTATION=